MQLHRVALYSTIKFGIQHVEYAELGGGCLSLAVKIHFYNFDEYSLEHLWWMEIIYYFFFENECEVSLHNENLRYLQLTWTRIWTEIDIMFFEMYLNKRTQKWSDWSCPNRCTMLKTISIPQDN